MKHYWINIDECKERKTFMEKQFREKNIENYRISAETPKTSKDYTIIRNEESIQTTTPGEISCILSHLKAIKKGYDDGDPYFCVLEDDLELANIDYSKIFNYIEDFQDKNNTIIDILQLYTSGHPVVIKLYNEHFLKNEVIASFTSNSSTGKYLVSLPAGRNYGIAVKKENYLFHSENFDIPKTAAYQEVVKDIALKNIAVGSKIILKNIFFDFDKATLRPESTNELERLTKLLNDIPTLKIEISGHTDSKGADEYNKSLSNNRAKAVLDYLVKAGISVGRLISIGFGEEQPIASNDTDEGRQLNRRTEFKILSK